MKFEQLVAAVLAFASVCSRTDGARENRYRADRKRATDSQVEAAPATRRYVPSDAERRKRGFSPWSGSHDQFQGNEFSIWKPPVYQLNRPYYIPLYGAPGRTPIYFPPQPININPGYPPDNPPFRGPPYLPPKPPQPTTEKPKNATMKVINRNDFDDDDDRPVWGGSDVTRAPPMVPTRPPRPPGLPEFPPLVHDIGGNGVNMLAADDEYDDTPAFIPPPSTSRPILRTTRRVSTTRRPPAAAQVPPVAAQVPPGPSNCVWAVVSCCSGSSSTVAESCFEQKGCPGPFWDRSPCDSDFARAAIATALNYYKQ